ncbi:universal stress protein [Streptomyces polygonati]|uniref:Universal stress protein n=1 Tax=Streptomyces polygonati TaxID=1617087 RepID=A0ABV8HYN9_9ACTN
MAEYGRVVVGISGSLRGLTALHRAVAEARHRDSELVGVMTWTPPGGEVASRRNSWPPLLEALENAACERLEQSFRDAFGGCPSGVRCRLTVVRGGPGPVLARIAREPEDLLVIGTGRRGSLLRLFHGDVSRYCLAHARCPVLAVPPSELLHDVGRAARVLDELPPTR